MKLFSCSKNIKFNARPDGTLKYEESTNVAIEAPETEFIVKGLRKLATYVAKVYRMIRSKFSS